MGEIGIDKILLIAFMVLILFGAKRIPEIAGSFGKGIKEFKRSMSDIAAPEPPPPAALPPQQVRQGDEARPEPKRLV